MNNLNIKATLPLICGSLKKIWLLQHNEQTDSNGFLYIKFNVTVK